MEDTVKAIARQAAAASAVARAEREARGEPPVPERVYRGVMKRGRKHGVRIRNPRDRSQRLWLGMHKNAVDAAHAYDAAAKFLQGSRAKLNFPEPVAQPPPPPVEEAETDGDGDGDDETTYAALGGFEEGHRTAAALEAAESAAIPAVPRPVPAPAGARAPLASAFHNAVAPPQAPTFHRAPAPAAPAATPAKTQGFRPYKRTAAPPPTLKPQAPAPPFAAAAATSAAAFQPPHSTLPATYVTLAPESLVPVSASPATTAIRSAREMIEDSLSRTSSPKRPRLSVPPTIHGVPKSGDIDPVLSLTASSFMDDVAWCSACARKKPFRIRNLLKLVARDRKHQPAPGGSGAK
ncbi:hypothetical protein ACP70R_043392 [Stipagrostis hirtigluma subsp. patula]